MSRISRRDFVTRSSSCAAHLALAAAVAPDLLRTAWARAPLGNVVASEPFGSLEQVADGIWALISTPLGGDRTTLSNGGLIAGRSGVLAIEGFNQPSGASWLAAKARDLTGKLPTHVVVTHYHADHANGVAGYLSGETKQAPTVRATERGPSPCDPSCAMKSASSRWPSDTRSRRRRAAWARSRATSLRYAESVFSARPRSMRRWSRYSASRGARARTTGALRGSAPLRTSIHPGAVAADRARPWR